MKKKNTVGTVPNSNRKIVARDKQLKKKKTQHSKEN